MRILKATLQLILLSHILGCAYFVSWNELSETWLGRSISEFEAREGTPDRIISRGDGNKVYKYKLKELDPSCIHYWIVDPRGKIVDFYYEGYCRPIG